MTKWCHYPTSQHFFFQLILKENRLTVGVYQDGVTTPIEIFIVSQQDIKNKLLNGVQFSVKSPTISCKYLSMNVQGQVIMRKFQITMELVKDFDDLVKLFTRLGFTIKNGNYGKETLPNGIIESQRNPVTNDMSGLQSLLFCGSQVPNEQVYSTQMSGVSIRDEESLVTLENQSRADESTRVDTPSRPFKVPDKPSHLTKICLTKDQSDVLSSKEKKVEKRNSPHPTDPLVKEGTPKPTLSNNPQTQTHTHRKKHNRRKVRITRQLLEKKLNNKKFMKWVSMI